MPIQQKDLTLVTANEKFGSLYEIVKTANSIRTDRVQATTSVNTIIVNVVLI